LEPASLTERSGLFLTYVLAPDDGFKGDMFVFPIDTFADIVRRSDKLNNGSYRVYISRSQQDAKRWYVRRRARFGELNDETTIDVTAYYRNFACLE
jgi:hypothetical protein